MSFHTSTFDPYSSQLRLACKLFPQFAQNRTQVTCGMFVDICQLGHQNHVAQTLFHLDLCAAEHDYRRKTCDSGTCSTPNTESKEQQSNKDSTQIQSTAN